jgi:peroxiredoxin/predicted 2-oxoglutarate/Fe(II)-dependent dioxygenase YbiX
MELNTKTLNIRDHAPLFGLSDQHGDPLILRDLAGKPIVLIFYAKDEIPICSELAFAFRDSAIAFDRIEAQILSISLDLPQVRATFAAKHSIPFPLLSDPDLKTSHLYGVVEQIKHNDRIDLQFNRIVFLLDLNLRIVKIYNATDVSNLVAEVLLDIETLLPRETPRHLTTQAPVLLIPNVLSPELCRQLIQIWMTEGHDDSGFMKRDGDKTVGYLDYRHKVRQDHFMADGEAKTLIDKIMQRRVFPEIEKAFDYKVSRRETYKIACYESERGGYFRPHRDNTTGGTKHRKFAMTLNLNADQYEGGYLRFPEYGAHLYKPDTGSAVIFSCSLLHEATDVTAGHRFALLSFFYSEQEAMQRIAYEEATQNDYSNVVKS